MILAGSIVVGALVIAALAALGLRWAVRTVVAGLNSIGIAIVSRFGQQDVKLDDVKDSADQARAASTASLAALNGLNAAVVRLGAGPKRPPSPSSPDGTGSFKAIVSDE